MTTTVATKGQVIVPKEVRDLPGITPGSAVIVALAADGTVVLSKAGDDGPAAPPPFRFAKLRGRATAGLTTDEIMALMRD